MYIITLIITHNLQFNLISIRKPQQGKKVSKTFVLGISTVTKGDHTLGSKLAYT